MLGCTLERGATPGAHHAVLQEERVEGGQDGLVSAVAAPVPTHARERAAHLALRAPAPI